MRYLIFAEPCGLVIMMPSEPAKVIQLSQLLKDRLRYKCMDLILWYWEMHLILESTDHKRMSSAYAKVVSIMFVLPGLLAA